VPERCGSKRVLIQRRGRSSKTTLALAIAAIAAASQRSIAADGSDGADKVVAYDGTVRMTTISAASGGNATPPTGNGGRGGGAFVTESATNPSLSSFISPWVVAGTGGAGIGVGFRGGAGGAASFGAVSFTDRRFMDGFTGIGGAGGAGFAGADGGPGGSAFSGDLISYTTTADVRLTRVATGGAGGASEGGLPGIGGHAAAALTLTSMAGREPSFFARAQGGIGGSNTAAAGGSGTAGGNATVSADVTVVDNATVLNLASVGGVGGNRSAHPRESRRGPAVPRPPERCA
jgi:hypothetical protein